MVHTSSRNLWAPTEQEESLSAALDRLAVPGKLWQSENGKVRCVACGHRCLIAEGRRGICKVRFNQGGELRVPSGYVAGLACDPVEKKPFNHVLPGSDALTFGMLGCDFHCAYCQNWVTSQALRDPSSRMQIRPLTAQQLVRAAQESGASLVVSSYNEPLITAEWAVAVFAEAHRHGFPCAFVSNGNATPEAIEFLKPWLVAYKIDLKCFNDRNYRSLGGTLKHVLEGIRQVHRAGLWLEIVTLLIPGFNDSEAELRDLTGFLVALSPDIPWHVTAFHPDYRMTDPPATRASQLMRAAEIGSAAGLRFVYAGNAPGSVGHWEHTFCPGCHVKLIDRLGYLVREYRITAQGRCPDCGRSIPGIWPSGGAASVKTGSSLADACARRPRPVANANTL